MVKRLSAKEARDRFAEILGQVHFGKDTVIVEKAGKPVAAVIDMERYERLARAWMSRSPSWTGSGIGTGRRTPSRSRAMLRRRSRRSVAAPRTKSRKRA